MLTAPYDHPLNLTMQSIMVYGSWGITVIVLALALRMSLQQRTPFFVLVVLAAMVGAFLEPLYDVGFMLLFYTPGIWTHFTAFNIPQPLWTHSGYAILYALPALYVTNQIGKGTLTRATLYKWAGVEMAMSCCFEMIGINGGTYAYWGPHVFRVLNYPVVIGILETAQVVCFAVAASELRKRTEGFVPLLGLFVLFPCMFFFANFGAGGATIVAIHTENTTPLLVTIGTLISIFFAGLLIRTAASFLPVSVEAPAPRAIRVPSSGSLAG